MAKVRKVNGSASTVPMGLLVGVLLSLVITLGGVAISAYLIYAEIMRPENIGYGTLITLLIASTAGALLTAAKVKRMRVQMCLASGCCYYLLLLATTALFFGGQYGGVGVTALAVLVGSGGAALVGAAGKGEGKRRFRKNGYR